MTSAGGATQRPSITCFILFVLFDVFFEVDKQIHRSDSRKALRGLLPSFELFSMATGPIGWCYVVGPLC